MSDHSSAETDQGLGLGLLFGGIAVIGALAMMVTAPEQTAAWGFAAAVGFGCLAVVALHVF